MFYMIRGRERKRSIRPKFVRLCQLALKKKRQKSEHIHLPRRLIRSTPHLAWQHNRGRICCRSHSPSPSPSSLRGSIQHRIRHRPVWLGLIRSSLGRVHLHRNRSGNGSGRAPPAGSHLSVSPAVPRRVPRGRRSIALVIRTLSGCVCTICGRIRNGILITRCGVRIGQCRRYGHSRGVEVGVSRSRSGCDGRRLDLGRHHRSARRGTG